MNKYRRNLPTYNVVITCIGSAGLHHWWKGDENSPQISTIIKDGGICDFHKVCKNYAYASAWECMNGYGRSLAICNTVITCIRGTFLHHWWKGDKKSSETSTFIKEGGYWPFLTKIGLGHNSGNEWRDAEDMFQLITWVRMRNWWQAGEALPVVSTFIKDSNVGQFCKVSQSWTCASVLKYIIRCRISEPTYNIMIIHILRAVLHHFVTDWWNMAAVSNFIKDSRVCDFYQFIQNCAFEKMWQNWAPLQCGDQVCQKCMSAALEKDRWKSSSSLSPL
jgi:hypothetical protein